MAVTAIDPRAAPALARRHGQDVGLESVTLIIANMNCGGCLGKVERALAAVPGVATARGNLSAKRATVAFDPRDVQPETLIAALEKAGFSATTLVSNDADANEAQTRDLLSRMAVAGFAAANVMLLSVSVWAGEGAGMDPAVQGLFHWLSALIALPTVGYSGQPFFRSAWAGLKARRLNMDVPISLAILLSTGMSLFQTARGSQQVYFDASVTLLFFLLIGRFLDQRMRSRARGAAQNLLGMKAEWASVVRDGGSVERVPARVLAPGMRVLVAAGERLPADGRVVSGRSDLDESLLTGETLPRRIAPGDTVFAGTVNLGSPVELEITAVETGTLLADMARLMESAEQSRGRYVRLADRAARLYSPLVHLLALATFLSWISLGFGWEPALTAAIAVLIITCPCALALAVPAVQVAASGRLFSKGMLVKAPDGLERLSGIDTVIFDKTGTLTRGQPELVNADAVGEATLADAAGLAAASRHPYAQALVRAARRTGLEVVRHPGVTETGGAGLSLRREDGETRLGSAEWVGVPSEEAQGIPASLWYRRAGEAPVPFVFEDVLREDAAETVAHLRRAGLAVELLSGDREEEVRKVARAAGIDEARGRCTPQDKIARLDALKASGRRVLMVGDGLNDAPALAAGWASAAPSSAADISQMASDTVFQGGKLAPLIELLKVARRAQRMAFENFAIAGAYNVVFVPLAALGYVNPLIAALAMSTSSILVTANALRLRGMRLDLAR